MADKTPKDEKKKDLREEAPASEEDKQQQGKRRRLVVMLGIILVMIAFQVGLAWLLLSMMKGEDPSVVALKEREVDEKRKVELRTTIGMGLPEPIEVTVNLAGSGGDHFLKTKIQMEWDGKKFPALLLAIEHRLPKVRNIIIDVLGVQSKEDLLKPDGTAKQRVRETIKNEINAILPEEEGKIDNIYLQEFLIQ